MPDEPQTLPCRCGDTLDLFSSKQEDDTGVTTYWYLCPRCATRIEVQVVRLPDEPGQKMPRWHTTSTEYPPPRRYNPNADSAEEALGEMTCHCGAILEIEGREEIGPVTVLALKCPECGRALTANVERQAL
jgi:ribosomal protein S27AE